jgi:phosphatidylglycerophosphatase A
LGDVARLPRLPTWGFIHAHPAHWIAFGAGAGLAPFAPGTFGTLLAIPLYVLMSAYFNAALYLGLTAALFLLGTWACAVTGRALGVADHGGMVWDETVAFLLVLFFTPAVLAWQVAAFVLFRVFDILKPAPIRYFDLTVKGGFGVMFDDLLAAGYTLIVMAIAKTILEKMQ